MRDTTSICTAMVAAIVVWVAGCSGDDSQSDCPGEQERNPLNGECVSDYRSRPGPDSGADTRQPADTAQPRPDDTGGGPDTTRAPDSDGPAPDTGLADGGTDVPGCVDEDGDEFAAERCGGRDCDDSNRGTHPGATELCDTVDNDCDGTVNNDVSCTFHAHTKSELYKIDPFANEATRVQTSNAPRADFFDMDTHPDGTLYTVAGRRVWKLDDANRWQAVGSTSGATLGTPNGMAIDRRGTGFLTGATSVYELDVANGGARKVGDTGGYSSSGDCVIGKKGTLLMTAAGGVGGDDVLVEIDSRTASATKIGATNHDEIWGLTAAWGNLYGVTSEGTLVEINARTGASTEIHTFQGLSFYGAASTPASRRSGSN